jgi:hypothetical protein
MLDFRQNNKCRPLGKQSREPPGSISTGYLQGLFERFGLSPAESAAPMRPL